MTKKNKIKCWLCHRLREPSTWVALAVPFMGVAPQIANPWQFYAYMASLLCAVLGIILRDSSPPPPAA